MHRIATYPLFISACVATNFLFESIPYTQYMSAYNTPETAHSQLSSHPQDSEQE